MGDTNSNDTCQNHERFRIIRNVRIDIHQRLKIKQDYNNKTTFTTRPVSQPDPFHNQTVFTTRPYSQQDHIHNKIFTRPYSQQENTKHAPLSPYCPWVSVPSVLRAHPATYEASPRHSSGPIQRRCAPVSRTWKVNATKKTVLVLTVHASNTSQTEQIITQQARMFV